MKYKKLILSTCLLFTVSLFCVAKSDLFTNEVSVVSENYLDKEPSSKVLKQYIKDKIEEKEAVLKMCDGYLDQKNLTSEESKNALKVKKVVKISIKGLKYLYSQKLSSKYFVEEYKTIFSKTVEIDLVEGQSIHDYPGLVPILDWWCGCKHIPGHSCEDVAADIGKDCVDGVEMMSDCGVLQAGDVNAALDACSATMSQALSTCQSLSNSGIQYRPSYTGVSQARAMCRELSGGTPAPSEVQTSTGN